MAHFHAMTVLFSLLFCTAVAAMNVSVGSVEFFSDDACTQVILDRPNNIPRDVCLPGTSSAPGKAFRVKDRPYCEDGTRPSLLLYQDCTCDDGVANAAPDAQWGDYADGSCIPLLGGEFWTFVLYCGKFDVPTRTAISFSATFPGPAPSTPACSFVTAGSGSSSSSSATGSAASSSTTPTGSSSKDGTKTVTPTSAAGQTTTAAASSSTKSNSVGPRLDWSRMGITAAVVSAVIVPILSLW